jgi:hypothetical protein
VLVIVVPFGSSLLASVSVVANLLGFYPCTCIDSKNQPNVYAFPVTAELIVIVPTRSRPHNVRPLVRAWRETGAFRDGADVVFVYDNDDPLRAQYLAAFETAVGDDPATASQISWLDASRHEQLVPKLNKAADYVRVTRDPYALGFMGDDHHPASTGWVAEYLRELRDVGTGIVSCSDGYRPDDLPTQWAMTADIVQALGGMVPAPVEHLFCDDAVRDLAQAAGCYRYRVDLLIDHLNPYAGKRAPIDEQYARVNAPEQYARDRPIYRQWKREVLPGQAALISAIRKGLTS